MLSENVGLLFFPLKDSEQTHDWRIRVEMLIVMQLCSEVTNYIERRRQHQV